MEMIKENALEKYVEMIKNSWTFNRMTKEEKEKIIEILYSGQTKQALKGKFSHRWDILQAIYSSFLYGIGYNGYNWKNEINDDCPTF